VAFAPCDSDGCSWLDRGHCVVAEEAVYRADLIDTVTTIGEMTAAEITPAKVNCLSTTPAHDNI